MVSFRVYACHVIVNKRRGAKQGMVNSITFSNRGRHIFLYLTFFIIFVYYVLSSKTYEAVFLSMLGLLEVQC